MKYKRAQLESEERKNVKYKRRGHKIGKEEDEEI